MLQRMIMVLTESYPGDSAYQKSTKEIEDANTYSRVQKYKLPDGNEESMFVFVGTMLDKAVAEAEKILNKGR